MNLTSDREDFAHGQGLLSQLPESYFAILKATRLEQQVDNSVVCTFEVPGIGRRKVSASSSVEAIRLSLIELASFLTTSLPTEWVHAMTANTSSTERPEITEKIAAERFQSKNRQLTIGVTMPTILKEHLNSLANSQGTSFADVSRSFAVFGFEDFENKSFFTSSQSLFSTLGSELRRWQHSDTEQVMLRLDPNHAVRIRSAAKEYCKSESEFGALCMAHGLVLHEQLAYIEKKIENFKGAAIRPLVAQLGLDSYAAPLLSGVLGGSIRAPKALLTRLANLLEASEEILEDLFKRYFADRLVPAFKAENGKPTVKSIATPWEEAVKSLKLSPDQTKVLLELGA
jgi:hypothetical protein